VAKSGTWRLHEITIADTELEPGVYWVAIEGDENTTTIVMGGNSFYAAGALESKYYDLAGYGPFTAPCPAVSHGNYHPLVVLRVKEVYQP